MVLFFRHENQLHPPSMSDQEILRSSKKSDVINCIKPVLQDEEFVKYLTVERLYIR